jgi:hypothetical protein
MSKRRIIWARPVAYIAMIIGITVISAAGQTAASDQQTPRLANGKPDLTGVWTVGRSNRLNLSPVVDERGNSTLLILASRRCGPTQVNCGAATNQTVDYEFEAPSRRSPNRPLYKPEYWDKVQQFDMWTNKEDPVMTCQPLGVPRMGPPRRIYQTLHDITFLYVGETDGGGGYPEYRVIPIDGRKHDPVQSQDILYLGHTVGHWERDTLVLDSVAFNDLTWLARGGFFHSDQMRVIEQFTRQGDTLRYEVTVEDPEVLVEPWVMTPRVLQLNTNIEAGFLSERGACKDYDTEQVTSQIRH